MMPVIRVGDDVKAEIERRGKFGDNHDSVLRRVLGLEKPRHRSRRKRAERGSIAPMSMYREAILKVLGAAPSHHLRAADALRLVGDALRDQLREADRAKLPTGAVRWMNRTQWARNDMVDEGLLESVDSAGRGVWKLTAGGVIAARQLADT
jgi:hypothetical protein